MATVKKGNQNCKWGVDDNLDYGTITDLDIGKESVQDYMETQQGQIDGVIIYDEQYSVTGTVIASGEGTAPKAGDTMTVGAVTVLLVSVGKVSRHKGKMAFSIRGRGGANLNLAGGGGSE